MKRYNQQKRKFYFILIMLFILSIGLGYAVLTETLTISNSVAISEMKWDVGFSAVEDNGGTILSESSISSDGKSITVMCDFGSNTSQESCTAKATITNNSTFDVGLTQDPKITYDDTYIHTLTFKWNNHPTYENRTVLQDNFIAKGESEEVILTIKTKFMKVDMLPTEDTLIPITITLNFAEWQNGVLPTVNDLAVLKSGRLGDSTAFRSSTYKEKIKTITFEDKINIPNNAIESWDIGVSKNGNVMAYVTTNLEDSSYYDLHIQSDTQLYANKDMSYWFSGFTSVDTIKGLDKLDTSGVTNMRNMFDSTGKNSTIFSLDVSNFDTSQVINMEYMFFYTGYNSNYLTFEELNFDTGKVTDMGGMFCNTGYNNPTFKLNVSNFDTSQVIDMSTMFFGTGYYNKSFTLDVSNFDTSNVTDMRDMFNLTGYNSEIFTLDVSKFNTSNVTNMYFMFNHTGYSSSIFTLDLSNFDMSNVVKTDGMLSNTGYNSTKLNTSLTIKNPNTTSYDNMFSGVARESGSKITVNYTSETESLVDAMIATKWPDSNVVKGVQVD